MRPSVIATFACCLVLAMPWDATAAPVAGHHRYAIDNAASTADFSQTPARQNVVILQSFQTKLLAQLKSANPSVTVLAYKDLAGMVLGYPEGVASGVSTQEADANPDWYLKTLTGQ